MKRTVDIVLSLGGLILLSPLMMVVALLVRTKLGSPVLFFQTRPGLGGKPFVLVKFRTMTEASGVASVSDRARLTPFGQWLRASSLDELPELWNVLKGDMSMVGPRPLLMEYLDRYQGEESRRHEVRPGLTGLAQVRGRNATSWERRLFLDVWYVDHRSPMLDLRIMVETAFQVFCRKGINAPGEATMAALRPPRTGSGKATNHDQRTRSN